MKICGASFLILMFFFSFDVSAFSLTMTGDASVDGQSAGLVGEQVSSSDCQLNGEESFTGAAGETTYSDEFSYSGDNSIKMTIVEGKTGWGTFGGTVHFEKCVHVGGRKLVKGDEIWVRARMLFPEGFEFNQNGRNKFLRLRAFHDENGTKVSEGYNDLYLNAHGSSPFEFIFEGVNSWYSMGSESDFFQHGVWKTVEFYLKLDDKKVSEGGDARVRVWIDGKLIGETGERATLVRSDSFVESFNFFTYWDNEGAHRTQSVYVDDFFLTTDRPTVTDNNGYWFIGMGDASVSSAPDSPKDLSIR